MNETYDLKPLFACRICLTTKTRLYNLFTSGLSNAYQRISGLLIDPSDGLPQHACSICSILLQKTSTFIDICNTSHNVLREVLNSNRNRQVKNDLIQELQTKSVPILNLAIIKIHCIDFSNHEVTTVNHTPIDVKLENDVDHIESDNDNITNYQSEEFNEKFESDSDDEPLSKKVKIEFDCDFKNQSTDKVFTDKFHHINADVVYLTKKQQMEEIESRKESINYLNSMYKCNICYKGFRTNATYKNHMARHDPCSGTYVCEICSFRWRDAGSLRSHVAAAHERKFVCRLCSHVTKALHRAKSHNEWHKGRVFICKICGAVFSKVTTHLSHLRSQHPSQYVCDVCGESFVGELGLKLHKTKAHNNKTFKGPVGNPCDKCSVHFSNEQALNAHVCDPALRCCVQCGEGFASEKLLREHRKTHQVTKYTCKECNVRFTTEYNLSAHYARKHSAGGRGGEGAASAEDGVEGRLRTNYVCEICGKKCSSSATLTYHQRTHTGEKPYKCHECHKRFSMQQRLQYHIRTHTDERPFPCPNCTKAFRHKAALNRHLRVHTGSKPYSCSHCGKCFSQSNSVKTHVMTVHYKQPAPYKRIRNVKPNE